MKKKNILLVAFTAGLIISGCAREAPSETSQAVESSEIEIVSETETHEADEANNSEAAEAESSIAAETKTSEEAETEASKAPESSAQESEKAEAVSELSEGADKVYKDNFDVDAEAAKAFAEKVKTAVVNKDIEELADLASFPVYVGLPDLEGGAESRDEFINIGADKLFTEELVSSVEAADISGLSPSMAGFVISDGGSANIIFSVVDGSLAVTGINY